MHNKECLIVIYACFQRLTFATRAVEYVVGTGYTELAKKDIRLT